MNEWTALSDEFHLEFYKFAQNNRLTEIANKLRMQFTIFSNEYEKEQENRTAILAEHKCILDLLKHGNISEAEIFLHEHMISSLNRALEVFDNI